MQTELAPSSHELRHALVRGEIAAWYQPTMRLSDGVVDGFEALARWHHPRLGLLPASAFVPLAEHHGLAHVIDELMCHEVFHQVALWQEDVVVTPGFRVALNISAVEFGDGQFVAHVARAIDHAGVDPRGLMLELPRTGLIRDVAGARRGVDQLHELGLELALADAGSGWATHHLLSSLPFELFKIDRTVLTASGCAFGPSTVGALVAMANDRRAKVLVGRIETADEAEELRRLGCHDGQGFLWMAALPPDAAEALLTMGSRAPL
jgi:EAL domain-containing protein (putative c-di-GMP-specific phosphodiesterase class I)